MSEAAIQAAKLRGLIQIEGCPYDVYEKFDFREGEVREFAWAFNMFDTLEDGIITTEQVRKALKWLGEEPTDKFLLTVLNDVDPHARGVVDFQRFLRIMTKFDRSFVTEDELVNAFKIFDVDRSGTIDSVELQDVMKKLGFDLDPLKAQKMVDEADGDGSGDVGYEEFVRKIIAEQ
eukprot:TRINITY_DN55027_c0_g1_i1.p1 TRINITY_DN55027_c0_g1~~TRINITY_DN55027_c0_g1_i1.p1  ORF type:complete len:176 (+),score=57.43 TRINITY_DN55027_c0_g1_i1:84-611(+)